MFADMSGPFTKTPKGNKYIVQVCDDYSCFGISGFSKERSEFGLWLKMNVLKKLKGQNINVKYLRCDNTGENQSAFKEIGDEYGIELEYTAPHTPQQNGVVERQITINIQTASAMMTQAQFSKSVKELSWVEA